MVILDANNFSSTLFMNREKLHKYAQKHVSTSIKVSAGDELKLETDDGEAKALLLWKMSSQKRSIFLNHCFVLSMKEIYYALCTGVILLMSRHAMKPLFTFQTLTRQPLQHCLLMLPMQLQSSDCAWGNIDVEEIKILISILLLFVSLSYFRSSPAFWQLFLGFGNCGWFL